jgi:hypothetical protein
MRYRFDTGLRAGETAHIRTDSDQVLLSYRSFASAIGIIAALVSGIVFVAGLAAVLLLWVEDAPLRALIALVLTVSFTLLIVMLTPRVNVTLYDDGTPALTISQRSVFPSAAYIVAAPNGTLLAQLRKSFLSRLGRNRWSILHEGRVLAEAAEESFGRALRRKLLGKFNRRFEANVVIETRDRVDAGRIVRRPDENGRYDLLELAGDTIDRRVAVALATLVLGREP